MNLSKIGFIFFIVSFLLVSSLVNATSVSSDVSNLSLCPRETGLFVDTIRNDEEVIINYNLELSGSASTWAVSTPTSFILASGERKIVYTYITPSSSADIGDYNLNVKVNSQVGVKNILHTVKVKDCYGASLNSNLLIQNVCPNDPATYKINIINSGVFAETFNIVAGGDLADMSSLSENTINLNPSEEKELLLFVNSPADAGDYHLKVSANSARESNSLDLGLVVDSCYDYTLAISRESNQFSVCEHTIMSIPINLKNNGSVSNKFNLEIEEGPVWVRLDKNEILLGDGDARTFILTLAPDFGVVGNYTIVVSAVPERGNIKAVANIDAEIRKCHSVLVDIPVESEVICKNVISEYNVNIQNNGEVRKNYSLELDGPEWISLVSESSITLDPDDSANIILLAEPDAFVDEEKYTIALSATSNDISESSSVDNLILDVKNVAECFSPVLSTNYESVVVYYDSNLLVPINIKNGGIKTLDYKTSLSGTAAEFSNLPEDKFTLEPGANITFYLYVAPTTGTTIGEYYLDLELYTNNGVFLSSKKINIGVTDQQGQATVIDQNFQVEEETYNFRNFFIKYKYYLTSGFAIILLAILAILFRKQTMDFFAEEEESDEKKKKSKSV